MTPKLTHLMRSGEESPFARHAFTQGVSSLRPSHSKVLYKAGSTLPPLTMQQTLD